MAAAVLAQSSKPEIPSHIESLANQARSLAPEFGADVLLRLGRSPELRDAKLKREWIEDAFRLAAQAQNQIPRHGGVHTDSRQGIVAVAHGSGLDTLTLQTTAVRIMRPTDPRRARELFDAMPQAPFGPLGCQAAPAPVFSSR